MLLGVGLFVMRGHERSKSPERVEVADVSQLPMPVVESPPITPIDPNSYLALSRQIADGGLDPVRHDPAARSDSDPSTSIDRPPPLRARDLERLLNL
jgi:hypothetical protein